MVVGDIVNPINKTAILLLHLICSATAPISHIA